MGEHVCDGGCKDHADASREQALSEVEQMLVFRWREAWVKWEELVSKDAPESTCSIAWGRQSMALDDTEAVAAMRGPGLVELLRRWRADEIADGGLL